MTKLEFNEVMKILNVSAVENTNNSEYYINDTKINYLDDEQVKIENLPLDIEIILYDNYPELVKELVDSYDLNDFFVFTKESLATIIFELQKYYNSKLLDFFNINDLDSLIVKINEKILEKVNPGVSTYKWMKYDKINNLSFERSIKSSKTGIFKENLREFMDSFDKSVNPYMVENVKLDDISNYIGKVNISGDVWDEEDASLGYKRYNCSILTITDIKTGDRVSYERNLDGFNCSLECGIDENKKMVVKHSYKGISERFYDRGEVISITKFENDKKISQLNYNVTKDKAFEVFGNEVIEKRLTLLEKAELLWDLFSAIEYSNGITTDNMVVKEPMMLLRMK